MHHFIIPAAKCAFLTCEGNYSLDEVTAAWRETREILAENEWNRALVDVTPLQGGPDMEDLFDLAKLFWRDFPPGGRIALVVRWEQTTLAKLLETQLRNVGVYLTVFVSDEAAEAWILKNSHKHQPSLLDSLPLTAA
jgi:hypothetical protein